MKRKTFLVWTVFLWGLFGFQAAKAEGSPLVDLKVGGVFVARAGGTDATGEAAKAKDSVVHLPSSVKWPLKLSVTKVTTGDWVKQILVDTLDSRTCEYKPLCDTIKLEPLDGTADSTFTVDLDSLVRGRVAFDGGSGEKAHWYRLTFFDENGRFANSSTTDSVYYPLGVQLHETARLKSFTAAGEGVTSRYDSTKAHFDIDMPWDGTKAWVFSGKVEDATNVYKVQLNGIFKDSVVVNSSSSAFTLDFGTFTDNKIEPLLTDTFEINLRKQNTGDASGNHVDDGKGFSATYSVKLRDIPYLKNLTLKTVGKDDDTPLPGFKRDELEYSYPVPAGVAVTVVGEPLNERLKPGGERAGLFKTGSYVDGVNNIFKFTVASEADTSVKKEYTVRLYPESSDTILSELRVSLDRAGNEALKLNPSFDEDPVNNSVFISDTLECSGTDSVWFFAPARDALHSNVAVTVNEEEVKSMGDGLYRVPLDSGKVNVIDVKVTAENKREKVYQVKVARRNNVFLKSLTLSHGKDLLPLLPEWESEVINYTVKVSSSVSFEDIEVEVKRVVEKPGDDVSHTIVYESIDDVNAIKVRVTDTLGASRVYTVNVLSMSSNAFLEHLLVEPGILAPSFASGVFKYTVDVPFEVEDIFFAPVADAAATVDGAGKHSLDVGDNVIDIKVTAEDKTAEKTYTVTVTRESALGILSLGVQSATVYSAGSVLYTDSPVAERVSVYSVSGQLLYSLDKRAGRASLPSGLLKGVLIVKGSSGWVKKVVI